MPPHLPLTFSFLLPLAAALPAQERPATATPRIPASSAFVPNTGQWAAPTRFLLQGRGATATLDPEGVTIDLAVRMPDVSAAPAEPNRPGGFGGNTQLVRDRLRLAFVGGQGSEPVGTVSAAGVVHCYLGNDSAQWRSHLPTWQRITWPELWPGVALTADTHDAGLFEFTLRGAPGADLANCRLQWQGAAAIEPAIDGSLQLTTAAGLLLQSAPIAWQETADGTRLPRTVQIELRADGSFGFRVDGAVPGLPTVVDPVLTLLGTIDDCACGVANDGTGLVYLAGYSTFPGTGRDVVVHCLDTNANPPTVLWSTWFGGSGDDLAFDVARGSNGVLTAVGWTTSTNLPVPAAIQAAHGGGTLDGFVAEFTATGNLFANSYLGGTADDWCCRVVMTTGQPTTIAALTTSGATIPNTTPARAFAGGTDVFVVQKQVGGNAWTWSTCFGGSLHEGRLWQNWTIMHPMNMRQLGLDVDASGLVLVAGFTNSSNLPLPPAPPAPYQPAVQPFFAGTWDAFAAILDPAQPPAQHIRWATYFGGGNSDSAFAARFAPANEVVLAGDSWGAGFPSTSGAFQVAPGGLTDATVIWLRPQLAGPAQLRYATRLGSSEDDSTFALAVDSRGHATLGGFCSSGFPNGGWPADAGGWSLTFGGMQDPWLARVRPDGLGRHDLTFGTYLGGTQPDALFDLDLDRQGEVAIAGATTSPTVPGVAGTLVGAQNLIGGRIEVLPVAVTRDLAGAAAVCSTPPWIELDRQPTAGVPFELLIGDAPANAPGVLVFGAAMPYVPVFGANLGIALPAALSPLLTASTLGAQSFVVPVPAGITFPVGLAVQALWIDAACPARQDLVSSGRLAF